MAEYKWQRRERKLQKKKSIMKKHSKELGEVYKNALNSRNKNKVEDIE